MPIEEQNAISEQETAAAPPADEKNTTADAASIDVSSYPTIDNDWDKLAAEYPDIYERFANTPNDSALDKAMREIVSFENKLVLDMGAGTGQYAFGFVNEALKILGMEADETLLDFDSQVIAEKGYTNIIPFYGLANDLPINDDMIDIALAVTVAPWDQDPLMRLGLRKRMVEETMRVLQPGGVFIVVTVPEGAYGGELAQSIFDDPNQLPNNSDWDAQLIEDFGFEYKKSKASPTMARWTTPSPPMASSLGATPSAICWSISSRPSPGAIACSGNRSPKPRQATKRPRPPKHLQSQPRQLRQKRRHKWTHPARACCAATSRSGLGSACSRWASRPNWSPIGPRKPPPARSGPSAMIWPRCKRCSAWHRPSI